MAGLISDKTTRGDNGIPLFKDIPVIGNLFKNQSKSRTKTELVLMIVPYIVESNDRAQDISQSIIDRFELLEMGNAIPANPAKTNQIESKIR